MNELFKKILGEAELRTLQKKLSGVKLNNSEDQAWHRLRGRVKQIPELEEEVRLLKILQEKIRGL